MKHLVLLAMLTSAAYVSLGRLGVAAAPDPPTFTRDVAPILHARCVTCHRAGEVAPMALMTYEDARPWARSIKNKVVSRQMPPWMAEPGVGVFENDPRLTDAQIATIAKWVDDGRRRAM
jgi:mono/diheme cytochrome c family protein